MLDKILLFPYIAVLKIRHLMYDKGFILKSVTPEVPTICLGNVTAGGTGKTPHTELLLDLLQKSDEWAYRNVAVLSRGYKRKSKKFQQVSMDGSANFYGDEPLQIKKKFPAVTVAVDKDRVEGCRFLAHPDDLDRTKGGKKCLNRDFPTADVIVLDDAFQYRKLKATYNIILVDYNRPVTKDRMLPFGRLRDLPSRMRAADSIFITKCPQYMEDEEKAAFLTLLGYKDFDSETCTAVNSKGGVQKVFFTCINYQPMKPVYNEGNPRYIYSKKLVLFTGIAKDLPLRQYLSGSYKIVKRFTFGDHHKYTRSDIRSIMAASTANPTAAIATTEKDAQRLLDCPDVPARIRERIFEVPISVKFLTEHEELVFTSTLLGELRSEATMNK